MQKEEFEWIVGRDVPSRDYALVEQVYTWHPSIREAGGRDQMAVLYQTFGMPAISDMAETAGMMMSLDAELRRAQMHVEHLKTRIQRVRQGDTAYEKCRKDLEDALDYSDDVAGMERQIARLSKKYGASVVSETREDTGI